MKLRTEEEKAPDQRDIDLGLRIRQRRKALGISQTKLAEDIGLTFQQIQKYERGFNRVSFSRLVDIAHALDCRVAYLVGDLDELPSSATTLSIVAAQPPQLVSLNRMMAEIARSPGGDVLIEHLHAMGPKGRKNLGNVFTAVALAADEADEETLQVA